MSADAPDCVWCLRGFHGLCVEALWSNPRTPCGCRRRRHEARGLGAVGKPRLLDLECAAGGATCGYQRAGFYVVGVDIEPQPHYCGDEFHQADAMRVLRVLVSGGTWEGYTLADFAAIHASPPCHDHSTATGRNRKADGLKGTGWMLAATVDALAQVSVPWVVENVDTAVMPPSAYTYRLCGSSFGLNLRRHRKFASNVAVLAPPCRHSWQTPRFRSLDGKRPKGYLASVVGVHGHVNYRGEFALRCEAMGIDWMTNDELVLAVPPAYTEWIGAQLLAAIGVEA